MTSKDTVQAFDPAAEQPVHLTSAAMAHARRQLSRAGAHALRLGISTSGCSGYMYTLDPVQAPEDGDTRFDPAEDLVLYITAEAMPLVRGTRIDYVRDGINALLKFDNPNAQSECGCGESFTV